MNIISDTQHKAVIARLIRALNEVALCEAFLGIERPIRPDHQERAAVADARALDVAKEWPKV